ncbi:unnamed protein product [marine sediment metagenome]|uniref:Uncharacterized protein n=1 Tax=marine sediment metagenome TaxID=412755 RepID=X1UB30_9ZZZZ
MDYGHLFMLIGGIVAVILAAYKIDPDRKYRDVAIKILSAVKDVTPDNVDKVIDLIVKALETEGKDPESKAAKEIKEEIRVQARLHRTERSKKFR